MSDVFRLAPFTTASNSRCRAAGWSRSLPFRASDLRRSFVVAQLFWAFFFLGLSERTARAQVTDLTVLEVGEDAELDWGTGVAPFRVYRSTTPDFYFGNRVVADGLATPGTSDPGSMAPGSHSYYYAVFVDGEPDPPGFGANAPRPPAPTITSIVPANGQPVTRC